MRAVLVATVGDRKLYYDLDAKDGGEDGALVTSDGRVMNLNFFSFVNKTSGLKKIITTPFHKFLWDAPSENQKKNWVNTFINKETEVNKELIEGIPFKNSLDSKKLINK